MVHGVTGLHVPHQSWPHLADAVLRFDSRRFDRQGRSARSRDVFRGKFRPGHPEKLSQAVPHENPLRPPARHRCAAWRRRARILELAVAWFRAFPRTSSFFHLRMDTPSLPTRLTAPNAIHRHLRIPNKLLRRPLRLRSRRRRPARAPAGSGYRCGVFPNLGFTGRLDGAIPTGLLLHDVSFRLEPRWFTWKQRIWHRLIAPERRIKEASALFSVSNRTAEDAYRLLDIGRDRIATIPPGPTDIAGTRRAFRRRKPISADHPRLRRWRCGKRAKAPRRPLRSCDKAPLSPISRWNRQKDDAELCRSDRPRRRDPHPPGTKVSGFRRTGAAAGARSSSRSTARRRKPRRRNALQLRSRSSSPQPLRQALEQGEGRPGSRAGNALEDAVRLIRRRLMG